MSVEQEAARLERYREFILRPTTDTWRESKRLRVGHLMELFRVVMDHGWGAGLDTLVRIDTVNAQHRRIGADLIDRWYRADPRTAWKADAGLPFFEEQCQWAQGSGGTVRNWLSLIRRVEGDHTTLCGFVVDDEGLKAMSPVMVASMVERMRIPQPEGERLIGHGEFIASPGLRYAGGHVPPLH